LKHPNACIPSVLAPEDALCLNTGGWKQGQSTQIHRLQMIPPDEKFRPKSFLSISQM